MGYSTEVEARALSTKGARLSGTVALQVEARQFAHVVIGVTGAAGLGHVPRHEAELHRLVAKEKLLVVENTGGELANFCLLLIVGLERKLVVGIRRADGAGEIDVNGNLESLAWIERDFRSRDIEHVPEPGDAADEE